MREGPLEILDRARITFLVSLGDGIGKADAGAEFYFAALSAERRGYLLKSDDTALLNMFQSVLKKAEEEWSFGEDYHGTGGDTGEAAPAEDAPTEDAPSRVQPHTRVGTLDEAETPFAPVGQEAQYKAGRYAGGQALLDGAYDVDRVVRPRHGQSLSGRQVEMAQGDVDDPYKNHNYLGADGQFFPLYRPAHEEGEEHHNAMVGTLSSFFLPEDPYEDSQSQKDARKEMAWEKYAAVGSHDFVRSDNHYGKLSDDMTNHAIYDRHYHSWLAENDRLVQRTRSEAREQGMDDDEIDHYLRQTHMREAKANWMDGSPNEDGVPHGLGLMDWLFGLEWYTPQQRKEIYDHMRKHGVSNGERPMVGDNLISTARLKRNFHQRFSGVYNHWVRPPNEVGEPIRFKPKPIPDNPLQSREHNFSALNFRDYAAEDEEYERARAAGEARPSPPTSDYDKAMQFMHEMSGLEGVSPHLTTTEDDEGGEMLSGTPYINDEGHVKFSEKESAQGKVRSNMLLAMLNIDPETDELYAKGKHPWYKDWDPSMSPFTQGEADTVRERAKKYADQERAGRLARNVGHWHYGSHVDPSHYPQELTEGEDTTLATHWQQPLLGGGMGKYANQLFNLLHEHTLELDSAGQPIKNDRDESSQSLLFKRSLWDNLINTRNDFADSLGYDAHGGMIGAMAPFGVANPEFTEFATAKGKPRTRVERGTITDPEVNLHPQGVFMSGKGDRATIERHANSVSPKFHNAANKAHYEAFIGNDKAALTESHDRIVGNKGGVIPWFNRFSKKGGAQHFQRALRKLGHIFHRFGTMRGMGTSPLKPHTGGMHDVNSPRHDTKPTTQSMGVVQSMAREEHDPIPTGDLGSDRLDKMNELFDQMEKTRSEMELSGDEWTSAKKGNTEAHLRDLVQEYKDLESDIEDTGGNQISARGAELQRSHILGLEQQKLEADDTAIARAGSLLRPQIEAKIPGAFSPDLPLEVLEANVRKLNEVAERFLHTAPHEAHGIHTLGTGVHQEDREMAGGLYGKVDRPSDVKSLVHDSKFRAKSSTTPEELAQGLGLDFESAHVKASMRSLSDKLTEMAATHNDENLEFPLMTGADVLSQTSHYGEHSGDLRAQALDYASRTGQSRNARAPLVAATRALNRDLAAYDPALGGLGRTGKIGVGEQAQELGMSWHTAHHADESPEQGGTSLKHNTVASKKAHGQIYGKDRGVAYRALQNLDSVLISDPLVKPKKVTDVTAERMGMGMLPIDKFGPDADTTVYSLASSAGFQHEFGDAVEPTFDAKVGPDGKLTIYEKPGGYRANLIPPSERFWTKVMHDARNGAGQHILHPDYVHGDGKTAADLPTLERTAAQFKVNSVGMQVNQDSTSVTKSITLAALTNPDVIRKELGDKTPLLQPMHRIFELDDLESLRGFTGDWIVSVMPEGERGFVTKVDDKVASPTFTLSKEDKENFGKVTEKDFRVDAIKLEDGYYIFDILEFDEEEVHDTVLSDRIKILRGGLEGVENIHVPSASDTRLTDDEGLPKIVEDLQEENDRILLRDAQSTYMAGELRHPKWVLLSPGKDVVLMVLERRGSGPYTYKLGTGPVTQDDNLGSRGVEVQGDTYMEMGAAFDSPDKYNEGDHVKVNVISVGEMETNGDNLYTITGSEIEGEAEGEALVSQETLSLLAKSEPIQWLCEVDRAPSGIRITMPQGDVVYKATQSGVLWTVHSPLSQSHYLIRLAESQRPFWSPVAGALLRADVEMVEKEEVKESKDDAKPLIRPKKVEGTDHWKKGYGKVLVKGMVLVEHMLKGTAGSVGHSFTGAQGFGIGYATPIESPSGPTNLNDKKTMPDYDGREIEGEDYSIEPGTKEKVVPKHITVPLSGGTLEVTEDSAVIRT
jgi:hypothetical protein